MKIIRLISFLSFLELVRHIATKNLANKILKNLKSRSLTIYTDFIEANQTGHLKLLQRLIAEVPVVNVDLNSFQVRYKERAIEFNGNISASVHIIFLSAHDKIFHYLKKALNLITASTLYLTKTKVLLVLDEHPHLFEFIDPIFQVAKNFNFIDFTILLNGIQNSSIIYHNFFVNSMNFKIFKDVSKIAVFPDKFKYISNYVSRVGVNGNLWPQSYENYTKN